MIGINGQIYRVTNRSWWMCVDETQIISMEFHTSFMVFVTVHTKFHHHETLFFFFLKKIACYVITFSYGISFNENEIHMTLALKMVWGPSRWSFMRVSWIFNFADVTVYLWGENGMLYEMWGEFYPRDTHMARLLSFYTR